ncbi:MAG: hypothetical protein GY764_12665 [Halieaceae bacterium]|nr:hypothetical protein [Halieaceae bacterium]
MTKITTMKAFKRELSALPLAKQRQISARFIRHDAGLLEDPLLTRMLEVIDKDAPTAEELASAYHWSQVICVNTQLHSDLEELNPGLQAAHFVAMACRTALSPVYEHARSSSLALKVSMYCRMANTCVHMPHEDEKPDFSYAETAARKLIEEQFSILDDFLAD